MCLIWHEKTRPGQQRKALLTLQSATQKCPNKRPHSVSACILHFVPENMEICPSEILWLFFFFKHAMKSAADCPYVTVYGMQVSRWKPVDYTLATCYTFSFLAVFFFLLFIFLLRFAAPLETWGGRNNPNIKKLPHKLKESPSPSTQR